MPDLLKSVAHQIEPQVLVFLSSNCRAFKRILSELASPAWTASSALIWTDRMPPSLPSLPSNIVVIDQGAKLSAALGIRVTPFVLVAGGDGRIVKASPVNTLSTLDDVVGGAASAYAARALHEPLKEHSHEL
jgi:hypothetical protein